MAAGTPDRHPDGRRTPERGRRLGLRADPALTQAQAQLARRNAASLSSAASAPPLPRLAPASPPHSQRA
ncbi:protein of unknown function [Thauera humireducens]|nr:protein of unknown function [Thauera humireducens]